LTIQKDLAYLYALNGKGIKPGLKRVAALLDRLGNPQYSLRAIHVAGTNGKGSTCAMLAAVLRNAGYRVGLYTSPHLVTFNERIRVNDEKISAAEIAQFIHDNRPIIEEIEPTFFEVTTAMAFEYFNRKKVDLTVVETGLGGRLDATNMLHPLLTVITPIGKDHQEFLGNRLAQIAREKSGIAKAGVPCLVAAQSSYVRRVLKEDIERRLADYHYAPQLCRVTVEKQFLEGQIVNIQSGNWHLEQVRLNLTGDYQVTNLQTAIAALRLLNNISLTSEQVRQGIESTIWHGRLEILSRQPLILYDVGHNLHGIRYVVDSLRKILPGRKFKIILTLGEKKKIATLGQILNGLAGWLYISEIPNGKSAPAEKVAREVCHHFPANRVIVEPSLAKVLTKAIHSLRADDNLLILGSHYIAPTVYNFFKINI
jgi:dihydrofolate synthase/folylpolyglutamate synthase